jgi:hypothetical protein
LQAAREACAEPPSWAKEFGGESTCLRAVLAREEAEHQAACLTGWSAQQHHHQQEVAPSGEEPEGKGDEAAR